MTPAIKEILLATSSSLAASIIAKVTLITALAIFAAWLARGSRAAVRHALLAAAFGVTLLLPIASVLVPPVYLGVPGTVETRASAVPPLVSGIEQIPPVLMPDDLDARVISAPQSMSLYKTISLSHLLLAGWIAGGAIFLLPVVIGLWQIRLLRRSGLPWRRGQAFAQAIALDAGILRRVEVLLHEGVPGPMTCGIVHPAIVLPPDAESWNEDDLNRAFVHELEHVRRGDSVSRSLARVTCAVYWFHPLVWIAWRRLALEAERSCDDAVLRRSEATAYADQLVGLAKRLSTAQRSPLLAMANRADLATRVGAVLDTRQRRGRAGMFSVAVTCAAAMVLVISMSSLILVAAPQAAPAQRVTPATFDTAQGEPSHDKSNPLRLVAQAQPATVDRTVSAAPAPAKVEFEVASVRPTSTGPRDCGPRFVMDAGLVNITCASLSDLIVYALRVPVERSSVPDWMTNRGGPRFDIAAKLPQGASENQVPEMLQALLADRFKLVAHREYKEQTVAALVVAKGGLRVKEAEADASAPADPDAPPRSADTIQDVNGILTLTKFNQGGAGGFMERRNPRIGTFRQMNPDRNSNRWEVSNTTFEGLSDLIANRIQQPVVDMTGMKGRYQVVLEISLVGVNAVLSEAMLAGDPTQPNPDAMLPVHDAQRKAFNEALQKLGLQLESRKAPVEIVVVDRVEKTPTEN